MSADKKGVPLLLDVAYCTDWLLSALLAIAYCTGYCLLYRLSSSIPVVSGRCPHEAAQDGYTLRADTRHKTKNAPRLLPIVCCCAGYCLLLTEPAIVYYYCIGYCLSYWLLSCWLSSAVKKVVYHLFVSYTRY